MWAHEYQIHLCREGNLALAHIVYPTSFSILAYGTFIVGNHSLVGLLRARYPHFEALTRILACHDECRGAIMRFRNIVWNLMALLIRVPHHAWQLANGQVQQLRLFREA